MPKIKLKLKGRPGWSIECSAMSIKNLGKTFDIHCGGIDLIFPHHQNEIAQSEGWTGKKFVNYWLHNEWLLVNGQKMSKSLGNFYTLRDILAKGYPAIAVRYLLLSTHYRQQLNFTFEGIDAAKASINRLNELILKLQHFLGNTKERLKIVTNEVKGTRIAFEQAMDDDLNVSEALAAVFELAKQINTWIDDEETVGKKSALEVLDFLKEADTVFGVMNFSRKERLPSDITKLIEERARLRKEKKFAEADKIRADLLRKGIQIDDTPEGVKWKKA
ncbi:TPA: class I tRNA ligase family protein [Candidatus Woesearchaeota archaeon]|nr:class I tRNA ligase family protein [Candidatus Woesearchaeota archaeon]